MYVCFSAVTVYRYSECTGTGLKNLKLINLVLPSIKRKGFCRT